MSCNRNLEKMKIKNYIFNTKKAILKKFNDFYLLMVYNLLLKYVKHNIKNFLIKKVFFIDYRKLSKN